MSFLPSLLPSLVKWNISFTVFLILYFRNECEQKIPGGPFFESERQLQNHDQRLWSSFWKWLHSGGLLKLFQFVFPFPSLPTTQINSIILLQPTLILLSYLPVFENCHCLWLLEGKGRNIECADFQALLLQLRKLKSV